MTAQTEAVRLRPIPALTFAGIRHHAEHRD
jgi:hypothetical protein